MRAAYAGRKSYGRLRIETYGMRRLGELSDEEVSTLVVQNAVKRKGQIRSLFIEAVRNEAMHRGLL